MSSFLPSRRGSLRVETTVPTMRARSIEFYAIGKAFVNQKPIAAKMIVRLCAEPRRFAASRWLLRGYHRGLADGQHILERLMRPRDDVDSDQFAHAASGGSAGIGGRFHGRHIAANHCGDVAGTDLLPADERDLGRLHHRV